jgi:hypothetical protein
MSIVGRAGDGRHDLVEQFDVKPAEIETLFSNSLDLACAATLRYKTLPVGFKCEPLLL